MGKKCVIFGLTNMSRMLHYDLEHYAGVEVVAFTVDGAYRTEETFDGLPVVAFEECAGIYPPETHTMLICLGYKKMNRLREEKANAAKAVGYELQGFIHPDAFVADNAVIGEGNIILEGVVVSYGAVICDGNIIWNGCNISHGTVTGNYKHFSGGVTLGGLAKITNHCFFGMNSVISGGHTMGDSTLVGALGFVNKDTEPYSVYVPGRTVKLEGKSSTELL